MRNSERVRGEAVKGLFCSKNKVLDLSLRRNWVPPSPTPQANPPLGDPSGGGGARLACGGRGWGDPIPTKGQRLWTPDIV